MTHPNCKRSVISHFFHRQTGRLTKSEIFLVRIEADRSIERSSSVPCFARFRASGSSLSQQFHSFFMVLFSFEEIVLLRSNGLDLFARGRGRRVALQRPRARPPARFRDGADLITHPTHRRPYLEACFGLFHVASASNGAPLPGGGTPPLGGANHHGLRTTCLSNRRGGS